MNRDEGEKEITGEKERKKERKTTFVFILFVESNFLALFFSSKQNLSVCRGEVLFFDLIASMVSTLSCST